MLLWMPWMPWMLWMPWVQASYASQAFASLSLTPTRILWTVHDSLSQRGFHGFHGFHNAFRGIRIKLGLRRRSTAQS